MALWEQGPDIQCPAPDDGHVDPTPEEEGLLPLSHSQPGGSRWQAELLEGAPGCGPRATSAAGSLLLLLKVKVQRPAGDRVGTQKRKQFSSCWVPALADIRQRSLPEVTLASFGPQIATVFFPFVKSNKNQHMFIDICQFPN